MSVWLEPWAQEFQLPARSELSIRCWADDPSTDAAPEVECNEQGVVVYGAGGTCMAIFIDGVDQESFSAECSAPDAGPLSTRDFVEIVFADHPGTRPGGRQASSPWQGVRAWLAGLFRR